MRKTEQEMRLLRKELYKAKANEKKVMAKAARGSSQSGLSGKIRKKVPEKAMTQLELAFEKAFEIVFTKGDAVIDKMGIDKARRQYEVYADSLDRMIYEETLKAIDKSAGARTAQTKGITAMEGSGLGLFGMGLPDIPLFLAMLLKTCYEIAAAYGIDYRDEREKKYTIALFNTIFASGRKKLPYSEDCDQIGDMIDHGVDFDTELTKDEIASVSNTLATDMLVAKFLQGFTFAGVIGGPLNYAMVHKVSKIAKIKYRKRFLNRLLIKNTDSSLPTIL